jgi:cobalt-precorrin-5B (C1)-methyltransferase
MPQKQRYINGKVYRYGYTTGSCAAAATQAAVKALLQGDETPVVALMTPSGTEVHISVYGYEREGDSVSCFVVKDSGDDPDVTNGIRVYAWAQLTATAELEIKAGTGIGIVTKKGLPVEPGLPAINPVPLQMIRNEAEKLRPAQQGLSVEISIPEGVEISKRTFNSRLGILGGISVLGTSGLVVPMSDEAFKESLSLDLSVLREQGAEQVVLTPGNYGERFLQQYAPQLAGTAVNTSNFIGYMLHECVRYGFRKVLLAGHIGKLVKVAGGVFHTHSSVADARMEILASHYLLFSGDVEAFGKIMASNTTEEALDYIDTEGGFFDELAATIRRKCEQHVYNQLQVEVVLFAGTDRLLGKTPNPV